MGGLESLARVEVSEEALMAPVKAVAEVCFGATKFSTRVQPADTEQYLGVKDCTRDLKVCGTCVGWLWGGLSP